MTTFAYVQDVEADYSNYERVQEELGEEAPEGLIVHVAGPTPRGFRIIDVWDSEDAWERFLRERLEPARERAGVTGVAPAPHFESLAVRNTWRGA